MMALQTIVLYEIKQIHSDEGELLLSYFHEFLMQLDTFYL